MKRIINERDLSRIVRRVLIEGVVPTFTPEEFTQQYPNFNGKASVKDGTIYITLPDGTSAIITNN